MKEASAFYGVIIIAMGLGLLINFIGINPISALIYSAVLNGLIAPLIMFFIVQISGNSRIMGARVNSPVVNIIGRAVVGIMCIVGILTLLAL